LVWRDPVKLLFPGSDSDVARDAAEPTVAGEDAAVGADLTGAV